jgi:hypothetical protein
MGEIYLETEDWIGFRKLTLAEPKNILRPIEWRAQVQARYDSKKAARQIPSVAAARAPHLPRTCTMSSPSDDKWAPCYPL